MSDLDYFDNKKNRNLAVFIHLLGQFEEKGPSPI